MVVRVRTSDGTVIGPVQQHISNSMEISYKQSAQYLRGQFLPASNPVMKKLVLLTIIAFFTVSAYAQPYYRHHRRHHYYRHHHHHAVIVVR
jgi:hypothetical protein